MEEALFIEKEIAVVTLNSIGDAVISTDTSGTVTLLNLVAEKMMGWSSQEVAGRPIADVFRVLDATTREIIANPMEAAARDNLTSISRPTVFSFAAMAPRSPSPTRYRRSTTVKATSRRGDGLP